MTAKAMLGRNLYVNTVMANGPAAFWPMQEASGNLADISGNSRTATKVGSGGVTYETSGPVPGVKAITFAGSSGIGYSAADNNVWSSTNFSAEAWVYLDSSFFSGQYARYIIAKHKTSSFNEWFVQVEDTDSGRLTGQVSNTSDLAWSNRLLGSWGPSTGQWYHLVFVLGSGVTMYLNGVSVGTSGGSGTRAANDNGVLAIGYSPAVTSRSWKGKLTMVAFYDYALSQDQIRTHYRAMR